MTELGSSQISQPMTAGFRVFGWASIFAASALALRTVYEQTVMTWEQGPQEIGSALVHEHVGFFLLGIAGELCLYIWLAGFLVMVIRRRILHRPAFSRETWGQLASSILVVLLFMIPYGWWQFATIEFAGPGAGASSQLTAAVSEDQPYLVKALIGRGTRLDIRDSYGKTALEEACRTEHRSIADYLIGRSADLNNAPSCRKYREFAIRMRPEAPAIPPDDGLPKVPGTTIEVH